ncbi:hypothetical protein D3C71_1286810 [compost metagenome]
MPRPGLPFDAKVLRPWQCRCRCARGKGRYARIEKARLIAIGDRGMECGFAARPGVLRSKRGVAFFSIAPFPDAGQRRAKYQCGQCGVERRARMEVPC